MTFDARTLRRSLEDRAGRLPAPPRYIVAFSGGLDSTVLLHALADGHRDDDPRILAVHVDHGLQEDARSWRDRCHAFAKSLDVEFVSRAVRIDSRSGRGLEAAAREARYAVLRDLVETGDWILSAHHRDDLAETVLLNLMRGSGPSGMAGIPAERRFACGYLVRPLLDTPRSSLRDYAGRHGLRWVCDPSNRDTQLDRNYLRHVVLPRLAARWPDAAGRLGRSAALAREATLLLAALADIDLETVAEQSDKLNITAMTSLPVARQRNLLRHAVRRLGLPAPNAVHLDAILDDLVTARDDAQPLVAWPGVNVRRYRDRLYLLSAEPRDAAVAGRLPANPDHFVLGEGLGRLVFRRGAAAGLSDALIASGLDLRYREGGEEIHPQGQAHKRKLKKLLQEAGVVPWMRERIPLLYAGERLVAVGDLFLAADAVTRPGVAITWENRPVLR